MTTNRKIPHFSAGLILLSLCAGVTGCKKPSVVAEGMEVSFHYTLTVDGNVVDSSTGREPLRYVHGQRQIVPGLEEQMAGLKTGDKKQVSVPPEKGYGPVNPQAQQKVPRSVFQNMKDLKVGSVVTGQNGGQRMQAKVVALNSKEVTLDLNHPLAGKTLNFDVEVVDIKPAPATHAQNAPPPAQPS